MKSYEQYCALARALDRIGDRWTMLIIRELLISPRRYSDLREALPGIATNLLADRLRSLQEEGIVERAVLPPPAASTVWRLTDSGKDLEEAILSLTRWGGRWMLAPRGGDAFRSQWLLLALRAIFPEPIEGDPLVVEIQTEGEVVHLLLGPAGPAEANPGPAVSPDVRLKGSPPSILGVASGVVRVADHGSKRGEELEGSRYATGRLQKIIDSRGWALPSSA